MGPLSFWPGCISDFTWNCAQQFQETASLLPYSGHGECSVPVLWPVKDDRRDAAPWYGDSGFQVNATMGTQRLRYRRIAPLRIPMTQPSARGQLRQGRVFPHKWDTHGRTRASHQTGRRQNPNSRDHRGRCDGNRAVRTGGRIEFLRMPIPQASLSASDHGGDHTKERNSSLDDGSWFLPGKEFQLANDNHRQAGTGPDGDCAGINWPRWYRP